jgi:hypothetical protein
MRIDEVSQGDRERPGTQGLPPRWMRVGILLLAATLLETGCGTRNVPAGSSQVTLVITSTANDRLAEYDVNFQGITLMNQSGKTIPLLGASQVAEFLHVDGAAEPMLTVTVPQDVYTAATASISFASMTCLGQSGGLVVSTSAYNGLPAASVTVTVPQPLTITGAGMGLALNMQVSQSAQISSCAGGPGTTSSFTPTFTLSAFALPAATPAAISVLRTLEGKVSAVDATAGSLQLTLAPQSTPAAPLAIQTNGVTQTQGFAGLGALVVGQFVQVDGSLQPDGSVLATRIALADPTAVNVQEGPILLVDSSATYLTMYPLMEQGANARTSVEVFDFGSASFQVPGQFTNLSNLPFVASFTAANMVAGQNVYISSPAFNTVAPPNYNAVATTITLEPQTLDGTIVATATSGRFTVYSVQLANYDLFPAMAVQAGQTTLLVAPSTVQVYVDASTQQFSTTPPADGAVLRFFGLVFNDGGTLRMDCGRIIDGVAL